MYETLCCNVAVITLAHTENCGIVKKKINLCK